MRVFHKRWRKSDKSTQKKEKKKRRLFPGSKVVVQVLFRLGAGLVHQLIEERRPFPRELRVHRVPRVEVVHVILHPVVADQVSLRSNQLWFRDVGSKGSSKR